MKRNVQKHLINDETKIKVLQNCQTNGTEMTNLTNFKFKWKSNWDQHWDHEMDFRIRESVDATGITKVDVNG